VSITSGVLIHQLTLPWWLLLTTKLKKKETKRRKSWNFKKKFQFYFILFFCSRDQQGSRGNSRGSMQIRWVFGPSAGLSHVWVLFACRMSNLLKQQRRRSFALGDAAIVRSNEPSTAESIRTAIACMIRRITPLLSPRSDGRYLRCEHGLRHQ
jgi:hypothetical protein